MSGGRRLAVIGGGIAGLSAAFALAPDHDVVVLETEGELGSHATGRSAATLSETSGLRPVCALARASRPFLERPPDGFVDHPLTAPRGLLWIGRDGDGPELDDIAAVAASGVAPTASRITPAEATALVPALRPEAVTAGGVWEPDARAVDVAALLAAYARAVRATGAEIRTHSEVHALATDGSSWTLECADGAGGRTTIVADVVINVAGAWADVVAERAGVAPLGLVPMRRTACIVPAPDEVAAWPLVMDVAGRCYFEPEPGGLLLSPADEHVSAPVDAWADEEDVAWSLDMFAEATTLDVRHVRRSWAGLRTFTADRIPAIGWDPFVAGFFWLVGQGGAGIKTAPAAAAVTAAIVNRCDWPDELVVLGVRPDDLSPSRLRGT